MTISMCLLDWEGQTQHLCSKGNPSSRFLFLSLPPGSRQDGHRSLIVSKSQVRNCLQMLSLCTQGKKIKTKTSNSRHTQLLLENTEILIIWETKSLCLSTGKATATSRVKENFAKIASGVWKCPRLLARPGRLQFVVPILLISRMPGSTNKS